MFHQNVSLKWWPGSNQDMLDPFHRYISLIASSHAPNLLPGNYYFCASEGSLEQKKGKSKQLAHIIIKQQILKSLSDSVSCFHRLNHSTDCWQTTEKKRTNITTLTDTPPKQSAARFTLSQQKINSTECFTRPPHTGNPGPFRPWSLAKRDIVYGWWERKKKMLNTHLFQHPSCWLAIFGLRAGKILSKRPRHGGWLMMIWSCSEQRKHHFVP